MKKAFTLIELIVVIGILAILMSVLVVNMTGAGESARAVKCMANLKSLAQAVHQYASSTGYEAYYPLAGSREFMSESAGNGNVSLTFYELPGWINWMSKKGQVDDAKDRSAMSGRYRKIGSRNSGGGAIVGFAQSSWQVSAYEKRNANPKDSKRLWCIKRGGLWDYIDHNFDCYLCPGHVRKTSGEKTAPVWSYAMNAKFGWTTNVKNFMLRGVGRPGNVEYGDNNGVGTGADRTLLFAELQWEDWIPGVTPDFSAGSGYDNDGILQYRGCSNTHDNEIIGFNHKSGRDLVGHVVFVDGHADKIVLPTKPGKKNVPALSKSELQELTMWLCEGESVRYNGGSQKYEKLR